jgi:hypothetical protein
MLPVCLIHERHDIQENIQIATKELQSITLRPNDPVMQASDLPSISCIPWTHCGFYAGLKPAQLQEPRPRLS